MLNLLQVHLQLLIGVWQLLMPSGIQLLSQVTALHLEACTCTTVFSLSQLQLAVTIAPSQT